jgi:hypothetical protein
MSESYVPDLDFSDEDARNVIGKRVLVGVTHRTLDDEVVSLEQFHGVIDRVSRSEVLILRFPAGGERAIPPDLSWLEPAAPGEYRLKTTGEVVVDPDFTGMWTVYPKGYQGGPDV